MGLTLMAALAGGGAIGLLVTAILGTYAIVSVIKRAKHHVHAWWTFSVTLAVPLFLLVLAVHEFPYEIAKPGSDYDIAMKNLFLQGLGYCISPCIAALLAALATRLAPGKPASGSQAPE